ncbi:conserved membrane hypothetical protein [Methylocella tundrae]|uniref:Capsular polysaccharide transport system permease protein n=1 Tax=Methylocella tundrae TaxID=227605 RepID=A0A8B6M603_METTU|nr:ABC transporter permease [Methylocella tundrae]VTZ25018.1 conserved membrane hypothetical protein [Methylocella tundrae]VTZ49522.1 conserved membrane hypothetical protein [Methylocella tundrae]
MQSDMTIKPSRPASSALAVNLAVVRAILLRDISVQTGPYGTGLIVLLLMPLGHLLAVVIVFKTFGRLPAVGTDQLVYYGVSILPFVIYVYAARQLVMALVINRQLLYFSRVKVFDILLARGALELANSIVLSIVVILILVFFSDGFSPRDPTGFVFAIAGTIYFAFSFGVLNGLIAQVVPIWALLFNLSMPLFWISSGIIFFPPAIPDPYDHWAALNPLLQCVEWIRSSYYEDYPDKLLNIPYLFAFSTACLGISLISEKLARRALR